MCVYIYLFLTTEHIPNRKICPVNHFKHYPKNIMKICLSRLEHDATVYVCLVSGPDICKQTSDIHYTVASAPAVTSTDFMIFMPRFRLKALLKKQPWSCLKVKNSFGSIRAKKFISHIYKLNNSLAVCSSTVVNIISAIANTRNVNDI